MKQRQVQFFFLQGKPTKLYLRAMDASLVFAICQLSDLGQAEKLLGYLLLGP